MEIAEIRRKALEAIVERDGLACIARKTGKPDRQINDMLAGRKAFGEKVARQIEAALGLQKYWLDTDVTDGTYSIVKEETPEYHRLPGISTQNAPPSSKLFDAYAKAGAETRAAVELLLFHDRELMNEDARVAIKNLEREAIGEVEAIKKHAA
jgi:hypothetical protein